MKRIVGWSVGIVAAAGVVVAIFGRDRGPRGGEDARFETAPVEVGRISARVTASGTLSALVTVQVGSQVSGRIRRLNADFNSPVSRGQILAEIDPQLFQAALEQARANLSAAEGNLNRAKAQAKDAERQYGRATALAAQPGIVPQADLDTAHANLEVAKATVQAQEGAVQQSRAALHQAEVNIGYTRIRSPIDGIVISRDVDVGQTVAASLQAPTLFTIAQDLRQMQVDTAVAEADVGKLRPDTPATFTVDAFPGAIFRGKVRQIRNAPQTLQNVVTYDAVIAVENPDLKLRPGMTANVTFVHAEKEDVLRIPSAAFRFRPPRELVTPARPAPGQRTVWILRDGRPRPVAIRTGISDGVFTEALEGELKPGDRLITESLEESSRGQRPGGQRGFRGFF